MRAETSRERARDYDTGWGVDNAIDEKGREHGPMSHAWALCVARLHGEAARLIMLDALGPDRERVAAAFGASVEKSAAAAMSHFRNHLIICEYRERAHHHGRPELEPEIRRRLAEAGALPS